MIKIINMQLIKEITRRIIKLSMKIKCKKITQWAAEKFSIANNNAYINDISNPRMNLNFIKELLNEIDEWIEKNFNRRLILNMTSFYS